DRRWNLFQEKQRQKEAIEAHLRRERLVEWLRRPESRIRNLVGLPIEEPMRGVLDSIEIETKYAGYLAQQQRQLNHLKSSESRTIPVHFCFSGVPGLSNEVQEKLNRVRPQTLGQAGRIPGVTPAAIAVLDVYLSIAR